MTSALADVNRAHGELVMICTDSVYASRVLMLNTIIRQCEGHDKRLRYTKKVIFYG